MGEQAVKNISDEVPVYRVFRDAEEKERAARAPSAPPAVSGPSGGRAAAEAKFRHEAGRMGIVVAVLFAIDVITGLGDWWFYWPGLAIGAYLAFKANKVFGGSGGHTHRRHSRELRFGNIEGGITIKEDTRLFGNIEGDLRVAEGVSVKMTGNIEGDLTVGRGAGVRMMGIVEGDVIDEGGSFHIIGEVRGARRPATAT